MKLEDVFEAVKSLEKQHLKVSKGEATPLRHQVPAHDAFQGRVSFTANNHVLSASRPDVSVNAGVTLPDRELGCPAVFLQRTGLF